MNKLGTGHWNHRVVRRTYRSKHHEETLYEIHEAHYHGEGTSVERVPDAVTMEPVAASAESIEDLRWVLERMLAALDKPVVDYEEVGR